MKYIHIKEWCGFVCTCDITLIYEEDCEINIHKHGKESRQFICLITF